MDFAAVIRLAGKYTLARMMERQDFKERWQNNSSISIHELLYPLAQAQDSVHLNCDVELGGTDQLFNLLVGRDLMPKYGHRRQIVMTTPILEGIDAKIVNGVVTGKKMSKSQDNYIGLLEDPIAMHRKVTQIDDDVIFRYFELLSSASNADIAALKKSRAEGANPMEIKARFARELITRFHDETAATRAAEEFGRVYGGDAIPEDVPEFDVKTEGETLWIAKALSAAGLVKSTGEGKRLAEQGGVEVDKARVTDAQLQLAVGKKYLLRVGSKNRRFAYVNVTK
jgi:tyrosyl-tRNA synthetase